MVEQASHIESLRFLPAEDVSRIAETFDTPTYVYDEATYLARIADAKAMPNAFGLDVRLAMKSIGPNSELLGIFRDADIGIDASSTYEAVEAVHQAGFSPDRIAITSQQVYKPREWRDLMELSDGGTEFNACSLTQLEGYGQRRPHTNVGVRLNPGLGSGHSGKTNVGGPDSSFGTWHEYIDQVKVLAWKYDLTIDRLHTHIGSGSDPEVWTKVAGMTLDLVKQLPDVHTVDLGGGFKVARMKDEIPTNLQTVGGVVKERFEEFAEETGRQLKLEIEPGTFLTANAGAIISQIIDITDTGEEGHTFIKVDTGMTENLRPSLYGAQHPLVVISSEPRAEHKQYVVVGHGCESGDLLTPHPDEPDVIARRLLQVAKIGDYVVMEGTGAYCAPMSADGYNSFPAAREVLRHTNGDLTDISDFRLPVKRW